MSEKLSNRSFQAVVIGASAGGIEVLMRLLPRFRAPSHLTVMVVVHLLPNNAGAGGLLPSIFREKCSFEVREAESGEVVLPGIIYMGAPNYHLSVDPNKTLSLSSEEKVNFSRPAIDLLFESAAHVYQDKLLGILLSGANNDGALGMRHIQSLGGMTVVQDPQGAEYSAMPQSVIDTMTPDMILNVEDMCKLITRISLGGVVEDA